MTPRELADAILALTGPELVELNRILRDEGGEPIGVREPREPEPPAGAAGAEVAWPEPAPLPPDYWETAE